MKTDAQIIDEILLREGSTFTDHPADKGGPTKFGVTLSTLKRYWKRTRGPAAPAATALDVRMLTEDDARAIYRDMFVVWPGFDRITNDALRGLVVDCAVQHGQDEPIEWLQDAVGLAIDGKFGHVTAAAANAMPVRELYARILARRCSYYGALVTKDPIRMQATKAGYRMQAENAHGWANRLAEFIDETSRL
jgi:lysozyme family protein